MPITRIQAPIRQQVEDAVRSEILEGALSCGSRLVERDLCEQFQVSRPVIREALRQLEAEGLLSHDPNGRVRVAAISEEDVRYIYDMRRLLEPYATRQFVRNAGEEERSALRSAGEAMTSAIASGDGSGAVRHKNTFYSVLAAGCGNPVLDQTLRGLQNRIRLLRGASMSVPGRLQNTAREIMAISDAIMARDEAAAEAACREHLHHADLSTRRAIREAASD
jgi:GntR family transcriptional regulator, trigonelline degradation regulator